MALLKTQVYNEARVVFSKLTPENLTDSLTYTQGEVAIYFALCAILGLERKRDFKDLVLSGDQRELL